MQDVSCAEGHHGVACALCRQGWAQNWRRVCIECSSNSTYVLVLLGVGCVIGLLILLYFVAAQPMTALNGPSALGQPFQWALNLSFVRMLKQVVVRMLSGVATRYLALTVNDDPYGSKAFAKPESTVQTVKILISFLQGARMHICTHTCRLARLLTRTYFHASASVCLRICVSMRARLHAQSLGRWQTSTLNGRAHCRTRSPGFRP